MFILKFVWVWALPYIGPLLPPLLRNVPAFATIERWFRRILIATLIIAALACCYVFLKSMRNPVSDYVSASEVNTRLLQERNTQTEAAVQKLHRTLDEREADNARLELELTKLRTQMEADRAKSPNPDAVVFPADDPWLRAKRSR
jgi:hypothetical protein